MNHQPFDPVRLDAYVVARELLACVARVSKPWRGCASLGDQAQRAARSAFLNIAEGAAHPLGSGKKRYHYEIALGSAAETCAALDAAAALGLAVGEAPALAERVTRLCGGLVRRARAA